MLDPDPLYNVQPRKRDNTVFWVLGFIFLVCLCGVIVVGFAGYNLFSAVQSLPTRAAELATATYQAHETQANTFSFIDHFDDNHNAWFTGDISHTNLYGKAEVKDGFYSWIIYYSDGSFEEASRKSGSQFFTDFDVYVDARRIEGDPAGLCYGLEFRKTLNLHNSNFYLFQVCEDKTFTIFYFDGVKILWSTLQDRVQSSAIHAYDWNVLGVSAHGDHFVFTINARKVFELSDDRLESGQVGVVVLAYPGSTGTIRFDNFALK